MCVEQHLVCMYTDLNFTPSLPCLTLNICSGRWLMDNVHVPDAGLTTTASQALQTYIGQVISTSFTEACNSGNAQSIALLAAAQIGSATAGAYSSNVANPGEKSFIYDALMHWLA